MFQKTRNVWALIFLLCTLSSFGQTKKDYTKFVNPFIGTGPHGRNSPAASYPFGLVAVGSDTRTQSSGYNYADTEINGFCQTRASGIGCSDFLDILFMPISGQLADAEKNGFATNEYKSAFSHKDESASPGYYSVILKKYDIKASFTVTNRCAYHEYQYPKGKKQQVLVDLGYGGCCGCSIYPDELVDTIMDSGIERIDDRHIQGYRISSGWAKEMHVYFYAEFSRPIKKSEIISDAKYVLGNRTKGKYVQALFQFDSQSADPVYVKVGISAVSEEGARKNLEAEIAQQTFNQVKQKTHDVWNEQLGRINMEQPLDAAQTTTFYTALYHSMFCMYTFDDVDGKYRGVDKKIHQTDGWTNYMGMLGLWDVFRAALPLQTFLNPGKMNDLMKGFISYGEQHGLLPIFPIAGNETMTMIGYHSMPVIADVYSKGIRNYDANKLFEMMKLNATRDSFGVWMKRTYGVKNYKKYGYVPADLENSSVSKTLEYSYDDFCISQMARMLGKTEDYNFYLNRSKSYKKVYDANSGFMRGRLADGSWRTPFDPLEAGHHRSDFVEGTPWQWTFFVPHDPKGLATLLGGNQKLTLKLDSLFSASSELKGAVNKGDITGLIGQYAHGNEPSHHTIYMYNFGGQPWKTQLRIRQVCSTLYNDTKDGLCGDDDTGQMSAWYVFSSMGFYPVTHGTGVFVIGAPQAGRFVMKLSNGKNFTVIAKNISKENMYIQQAYLNGKEYSKSWITYDNIMKGSTIQFVMGSKPSNWGTKTEDIPPSMSDVLGMDGK